MVGLLESDGNVDGTTEGLALIDGASLGPDDGTILGRTDGDKDGIPVGCTEGI